ncbi:protein XNDC1N isoform X2 [Lepisosteus oculatus]|uniref:protein XNDC1N isoform X2 n=1 Tax=Lepisosteus oculatus TaxID=7918 RepID=UPI00074028F8|nr:PREDICTED: short transient receptor potential channel 2-like isoform X2 [Lepisosteus oculatus]
MAPVKIKHIVSYSSQDPKSSVENLLVGDSGRPWLCSPRDRSGVLKVELQLDRATAIAYIDIGNCGSAFVQVDVGRSSWAQDQPYVTLLPTATLMSPAESRQGSGRMGVRMFKRADFLSLGADERWDRVRVTCSQPFNRRAQFGLSFLRIRSPPSVDEQEVQADGTGTDNPMSPEQPASKNIGLQVQEWLSSPAVQRTVFGQKMGESSPTSVLTDQCLGDRGEKAPLREGEYLSRTARMLITAARTNRRSLPLPSPSTASSDIQDHKEEAGAVIPGSPKDRPIRRQKRKPGSRKWPGQARGAGPCKVARPAADEEPASSSSVKSRPAGSPTDDLETGIPETCCPICEGYFSPDYLPLHASSCQGGVPPAAPGVMGSFTPPQSPGSEQDMVPCPLCSFRYPLAEIQQHASSCGDPETPSWLWVD